MTRLEQLLAETVPDGTFGGARTPKQQKTDGPDPNAAKHRADLEAAIRRPRRTPA
ncbi:hypothetical protein ACWDXD_33830 [Streptomyces sp. NPDC003314]